MAQLMTPAERALRERLIESVNAVRSAIGRVPEPDAVDEVGLNQCGAAVLDANCALSRAQQATEELAQLESLCDEGLLLVGSARTALEAIRSLLALVVADLEQRAA